MTARDATESIEQLLFSLEKLSPRLAGRENDVKFLRDMLQSHEFHSLMKVHQQVSAATSSSSPSEPSCCPNPLTLAHTVSYDLETCSQPEAQELFDLLTSPHMDALISTHDRVANKEYPVQSVITVESGNEEGGGGGTLEQPVKIVRIEKGKDPLGATVKEEKNSIVISRVLCGGAAEKSGLLHSGDIIHEINGKSMQGFSIVDVANLMAGLVGTVVFKITPAQDDVRPKRRNQVPLYVRPIFSYDPAKDRHSPCPEAGLRFERGEVLRVVNQEDPNWWQAVREGEKGITAGIIPSQKLRERLECYESYGQQREVAPPRRRRRNNKTVVYDASSHVFGKEIVTYEAIVKIEAQVDRPRPLLLIAPRGEPFNVNRLKSKLLADESNLFGEPLLHTTRPALPNEARGSQQHRYSFISKHNMEREIANNNFVEHGRVEAHHYGVSINSIRDVINSGKICVLTLLPQVIKRVRTAEVKPFIVYLRPPTAEYMRTHWLSQGLIRESGISDVLRQAVHIENTYSHYFDHTLIFKTPGHTHTELVGVARQLLQQRQWVPASWAV